ncbi:MAG: DUF1440 domain-containing protein [Chloroflexota bacterium]|nr:DUF1440 domain-containing protein [Chloroflexota bacterium]
MQRDLKSVLDGAIGGVLATTLMSTGMWVAYRAGLLGGPPPEIITAAALDAAGVDERNEGTQDALSVIAHFGFGAVGGALFAVLHRRLRLPIPPVLHGAIYATGVWAVSYIGVVPALGIMPTPTRDRRDRHAVMLLVHWVYGATLGAYVRGTERHQ